MPCLVAGMSSVSRRVDHPATPFIKTRPVSTAHINADHFNHECFCISLDEQALRRSIAAEIGDPALFQWVQGRLPSLFSARPVVLSQAQVQGMSQLISALESVVALPAYREEVLARSALIARHPTSAKSVFIIFCMARLWTWLVSKA